MFKSHYIIDVEKLIINVSEQFCSTIFTAI